MMLTYKKLEISSFMVMNLSFNLKVLLGGFSILSLFLNSIFSIWMFLELSGFFMLMIFWEFKNFSSDLILKFFLIQCISSYFFIWWFFLKSMLLLENCEMIFLIMFFKIGLVPFHWWVMNLLKHFNFNVLFFFIVIFKIIPLNLLICLQAFFSYLMIFMFFFNFLISVLYLNNIQVKITLLMSSISFFSILLIVNNKELLMKLYSNYSILMYFFFKKLHILGWKNSTNYFNTNFQISFFLLFWLYLMLISGLPPFTMFWMKLMILKSMLGPNLGVFIIVFCLSSIFMIYLYMNLAIYTLTIFKLNYFFSRKVIKFSNIWILFLQNLFLMISMN